MRPDMSRNRRSQRDDPNVYQVAPALLTEKSRERWERFYYKLKDKDAKAIVMIRPPEHPPEPEPAKHTHGDGAPCHRWEERGVIVPCEFEGPCKDCPVANAKEPPAKPKKVIVDNVPEDVRKIAEGIAIGQARDAVLADIEARKCAHPDLTCDQCPRKSKSGNVLCKKEGANEGRTSLSAVRENPSIQSAIQTAQEPAKKEHQGGD